MKKALSLIEICISIVMLGVMLVSMLGIICQGYRYLRLTRERIGAYYLTMGVMEEYSYWEELKKLDDVTDTYPWKPPHNGPVNGDYDLDNIKLNNIDYDRDVTISEGPALSDGSVHPTLLKRVDVVVSWGTRDYTLSTLKADY